MKVPSHQKRFALHALRHIRTTELVEHYGFDGFILLWNPPTLSYALFYTFLIWNMIINKPSIPWQSLP
ncbi:hypothetical protein J7L33_02410 [Candidatus Bathyarchaeota archaeon]|nr:hypothetical protein [Candidatus Bathyarchaeota archaeon]